MNETETTTEGQFENTDDLAAFSDDFFGQKKPEAEPETKLPAEQEKVKAPVEAESQEEVDKADEQDEAELKEEIPQEAPKRKTVQDRIDEVVRQREDQRREHQAELQTLRQELEALKKGPQAETVATEAAEPQPDAVDKDGNPIYGLGEFDPQYIRDLTRFTLTQERTKVQAEMAETQRQAAASEVQQVLQTSWNGKLEAATQEYPDFIEKGQTLLNGFNNLDPNYAGYLSNVLMTMDKGPEVLYYLSNHPDEASEIVNSGAQKATLALGRIESRFMQSEQAAPKQKFSNAPTPPAVRTRGTNGAFVAVAPDTDDLDGFSSEFFRKP